MECISVLCAKERKHTRNRVHSQGFEDQRPGEGGPIHKRLIALCLLSLFLLSSFYSVYEYSIYSYHKRPAPSLASSRTDEPGCLICNQIKPSVFVVAMLCCASFTPLGPPAEFTPPNDDENHPLLPITFALARLLLA